MRQCRYRHPHLYFYPRSPCGERRGDGKAYVGNSLFLSTLSLRRATHAAVLCRGPRHHFYPRSPCGERPGAQQTTVVSQSISIHALLAESDAIYLAMSGTTFQFLSTLSLRRATSACWRGCLSRCNFYPRSPCGERHTKGNGLSYYFRISIHALLAESDNHFCRRV